MFKPYIKILTSRDKTLMKGFFLLKFESEFQQKHYEQKPFYVKFLLVILFIFLKICYLVITIEVYNYF